MGDLEDANPSTPLVFDPFSKNNNPWFVRFEIGLDDVESDSGVISRLNNLGYFAGSPVDDAMEQTPPDSQRQVRSALEEFQCDHGLTVLGIINNETRTRLLEIHGC